METFLSILRGINVSGKNKIKMADLSALYKNLGFTEVQTYIQSGNVIFKSKTGKNIAALIEQQLKADFDFNIPVLIRTAAEIENTLKINPYLKEKNIDPEKLHVTFLSETPEKEELMAISKMDFGTDNFQLIGKEVFVYCPNGYGKTKLHNTFFEKKLKVIATTRNWKTCNQLAFILEETKNHKE